MNVNPGSLLRPNVTDAQKDNKNNKVKNECATYHSVVRVWVNKAIIKIWHVSNISRNL